MGPVLRKHLALVCSMIAVLTASHWSYFARAADVIYHMMA